MMLLGNHQPTSEVHTISRRKMNETDMLLFFAHWTQEPNRAYATNVNVKRGYCGNSQQIIGSSLVGRQIMTNRDTMTI